MDPTVLLFQLLFAHLSYGGIVRQVKCPYPEMEINLSMVNVTKIELGAFDTCPNMKYIHISGSLLSIDPRIFRNNQLLEVISLASIGLHRISGNTFATLKKLRSLNLADNFLTEFAIHNFPLMPMLEEIYLNGNSLTDLNVEELFEKFPSLKKLHLNHNSFECDRATEIEDYLKFSQIEDFDGPLKCLSTKEVNQVYKEANLRRVKGRVDNNLITDDLRKLKMVHTDQKHKVSKLDEKVQDVLVHIKEIKQRMTNFSNQWHTKIVQNILIVDHTTSADSNFVIFMIVGLTLALAIVLGVVIKCFINMKRDVQFLNEQEQKITSEHSTTISQKKSRTHVNRALSLRNA